MKTKTTSKKVTSEKEPKIVKVLNPESGALQLQCEMSDGSTRLIHRSLIKNR